MLKPKERNEITLGESHINGVATNSSIGTSFGLILLIMTSKNLIKIDLHTHSTLSDDGGITEDQYLSTILSGKLSQVAITDHNEIDFALFMNRKHGDKFIVGEEIRTKQGDLIALFIKEKIEPFQDIAETIRQIKLQNGVVYLPHPLDPLRSGIKKKEILANLDSIDVIEIYNARYIFPLGNDRAKRLAKKYSTLSGAVGSDSHRYTELGKTYNLVHKPITAANIISQLDSAIYVKEYLSLSDLFNPKLNKISKSRS